MERSPKKIIIKDIAKLATNPTILLFELYNKKTYDQASVKASIWRLDQAGCCLADTTGIVTLTLWETQVESVTKYQGNKYLLLPKEDASIEKIADIGELCDEDLDCEQR